MLQPSLKYFGELPQKSLRIAAGHIFTDIPESTLHITGFAVWGNFIYQHKFEQTVQLV